ncbi:MAG TPA: ATP-binding protein [Gaiellaceae bacterium]|nr:ATP-binding protein [Gaiellaceae bacterium]
MRKERDRAVGEALSGVFRSRNQLDTILRRIGDGVTVQDRAGRLVYANDSAARIIGFETSDKLLGTPIDDVLGRFELFDENREPFPLDRLPGRLVLEGGNAEPVTLCYRIRATGEERWSTVHATPILGADGTVTHAVNVFHDVTAVKREDERARLMADVTQILNRSLVLEDTLAELGRLAVPLLADLCLLDLLDEDGNLVQLVCTHADPDRLEILLELRRRYGLARGEGHPATRALARGRPVHLEEIGPDDLRRAASEPGQLELYEALGLRSYVVAPVIARGRPLGTVSLGTDVSGRRIRANDALVAQQLANRVAAAVDNALLYRDSRRSEERLAFLAEAGAILASSLDYERTLASVARLVVPRMADWCAVDVLGEDGRIERLVVAHSDPGKARLAEELARRFPPDPDAPTGTPQVIRSGRSELTPLIPPELIQAAVAERPHLGELLGELGLVSSMVVPLRARDRVLGAILFVTGQESGRRFAEADLQVADELARRAGAAIDNARTFREAERRADAARALRFIGEGVLLVDGDEVVRVWNPAAEAITGIPAAEVVGQPAAEAFADWEALADTSGMTERPTTLPVELGGRERWLSVSRADFPDGAVFAFRDVTEDQRLERLKDEFMATVSHQLRTPVTAVYGAARTLARTDVQLDPDARDRLFELIQLGTDRLAAIVNDILAAGQLEAGSLSLSIQRCEPADLVGRVLESARMGLAPTTTLAALVPDDVPAVAVDASRLEQVLANLVENAVKYSPDGGEIVVRVTPEDGSVRFAVEDEGLGIPLDERERVFDKFYRLDPNLTRGVDGTGLGLYICRELVERMGGRIWIEGREERGSVVAFDVPVA